VSGTDSRASVSEGFFSRSESGTLDTNEVLKLASKSAEAAFSLWKREFNKNYGIAENRIRLVNFLHNLEKISQINLQYSSFSVGLNKFADLSQSEFLTLYTGPITVNEAPNWLHHKLALNSSKKSKNWGWTPLIKPVADQGQCISGWAFATIGALEAFAGIKRDEVGKFRFERYSEQQLIDCSISFGNQGCKGGSMANALNYTSQFGVMREEDYPFTETTNECQYESKKVDYKNQGYHIFSGDFALEQALDQNPVAVSIAGDSDVFRFYTSGILTSSDCGSTPNHGALVIGYDQDEKNGLQYWLVKNSWGTRWGEKGYIRIARTSGEGICSINSAIVSPY